MTPESEVMPDASQSSEVLPREPASPTAPLPDEGRCKTCCWFAITPYNGGPMDEDYEPIEPGRWGQCSFITDSHREADDPHSALAYPQDASGYSAWLVVRDDFGCIEHTIEDAGSTR